MATSESYLSLLSSSMQRERNHTKASEPHRRTLDFLNALALVCISQASGQVIAVGVELPKTESQPLTLYITGNPMLDQHTKTHVREICGELVAISHLQGLACDRSPELGGWPDDVLHRRDLLLSKVLGFCHRKVLRRWTKRDTKWVDYMNEYREILTLDDKFATRVEEYDVLIKIIEKGYSAIKEKPQDFTYMDGVAAVMDNEGVRPMINEMDIKMFARGHDWSLERFIDKITDHVRSLDTLVRFAASHRMRHFLSKPFIMKFVNPRPRKVSIDPTPIREEFPRAFEGKRPFISLHQQSTDRYTTTPHCELTLLAHFVDRGLFGVSAAIGVSKLSCFGCGIGLEALNAVLQAHRPEFPAPFFTSGEHARIYPYYAYPTFSPGNQDIEQHMQEKLTELLKEHFRQTANQHYINLSDSTTSSFSGSGRPKGILIAKALES